MSKRGVESSLSLFRFLCLVPFQPDRYVETSKRLEEYLKTFDPEKKEDEDVEDGQHISAREAATDVEADGAESSNEGSTTSDSDRRTSTAPSTGEGSPSEKKEMERVVAAVRNAAGDGLSRQAERDLIVEQLEEEAKEAYTEMQKCAIFHDLH